MLARTLGSVLVALVATVPLVTVACEVGDEGDVDDAIGSSEGAASPSDESDAGFADDDDCDDDPAIAVAARARAVSAPSRGARTCAAYCSTYLSTCTDSLAFATAQDCARTCAGWSIGTGPAGAAEDSVTCRASFLEDGARSCIAAGPGSPICKDARIR